MEAQRQAAANYSRYRLARNKRLRKISVLFLHYRWLNSRRLLPLGA